MDVDSSTKVQQNGLDSWHPALRPDAPQQEYRQEGRTIGASALSEASDNGALPSTASYQLPFRPKSVPQDLPISDSPRLNNKDNGQHTQDTDNIGQNDTMALTVDDKSPTHQDQMQLMGNGRLEGRRMDAMSDGRTWGNASESNHDSGNQTDGLVWGSSQQRSRMVDTEDKDRPNSLLTPNPEGAAGNRMEMDRAWELEEKDTSSNQEAHVNRTNSFPVVPPLRHSEFNAPRLPQSQAEVIIEGEAAKPATFELADATNYFGDGISAQLPGSTGFAADAEDQDFFAHPLSATVETDDESRFEEGLPLMQTSQSETRNSLYGEDSPVATQSFAATDGKDESHDEVLLRLSNGESTFIPAPLDRKSTTQVLDSIHYEPHSATHAEMEEEEGRPTLTDVNKEGILTSMPNFKSQVSAEQGMDESKPTSRDEDLAEMWKAALGEDDLLEDDEAPVDPSAFFEGDGESFLEGNQENSGERERQPPTSSASELVETLNEKRESVEERKSIQATHNYNHLPERAFEYRPYSQSINQTSVPKNAVSANPGGPSLARQPFHPTPTSSRPQMPPSTQSFADKSKGGYTSPYDLPMDISRPKKRTAYQPTHPNYGTQQPSSRPPPPRSSSMFTGVPPPNDARPPIPQIPNAQLPALRASPSTSSFFEELPSTKSRPQSSMGRYGPSMPEHLSTAPQSFHSEPPKQSSLQRFAPSNSLKDSQPYELLPPEKMSLYANTGGPGSVGQAVPVMNARYSPAPAQPSSVPPPRNRYAASPSVGSRPPSSQILPFQPRTSSPLAQSLSLPQQYQEGSVSDPLLRRPQSSGTQALVVRDTGTSNYPLPRHPGLQDVDARSSFNESDEDLRKPSQWRSSPPPPHAGPGTSALDLSRPTNELETDNMQSEAPSLFSQERQLPSFLAETPNRGSPRRSQTQSPGAGKYMPQNVNAQAPYQRPASVHNQVLDPSVENTLTLGTSARSRGKSPQMSVNFISPADGRELDQLERWKGCPIFSFGFGGAIVTSFPKQIPRYATGQATPLIRCSPGEVKLRDGNMLPFEDDIASFPGPLKSRGKKKDVLDWLHRRITRLEDAIGTLTNSLILPDPRKRHEEKILLWKIVQILIEHDGVLDNNSSAEKAVRLILAPELTQGDAAVLPVQTSNASLLGISPHSTSRTISDSTNRDSMENLRKLLLHGEREKAVWHAVDNRLWAHAMLLSSTLDQSIWKQVSQEFVRQEVKTYGTNTESLAALYQIFAGNWEESADELVPPSARAGLQMVSKTAGAGPTKNALDGLDRWRETLTLILSNPSSDDGKALVSLGQLLGSYGRTEAAHICYIFAKSPNLFGGSDDPQVRIALLGADHVQHPFNYGQDLDSILLTETYDFARTTLSSSSAVTVWPHLQSFKLYHAMILAENGYKSEAQSYCEAITSTLNSTTKRSPYYHPLLLEALDSLMERLRQAPRDHTGSWISKPSIDKVSGSIWAKFNQYVAGDESDAASTGSGRGHDPAAGPFAGVAGDSPTLSRTPSSNDLYNPYSSGVSPVPLANPSNSRYAPSGLYTPRSSLEQQGRPTHDAQRYTQNDNLRTTVYHQQYQSGITSSATLTQEPYKPMNLPPVHPTRAENYLPTPPSQPDYMPMASPNELSSSLYQQEKDDRVKAPAFSGLYQAPNDSESTNGYEPPPSYDLQSSSYEPPASNHYEPPNSSNYSPQFGADDLPVEESLSGEKAKKKSFMDDDDEDDFEARAAAIRSEEKARKDREADEAFRRAAEADGKQSIPWTLALDLTFCSTER